MLITKEQQQALIDGYIKAKHNQDECSGFIDGVEAIMKLVSDIEGQRTFTDRQRLFEKHSWLKKDDLEYALEQYKINRIGAVKWLTEKARPYSDCPLKDAADVISECAHPHQNRL